MIKINVNFNDNLYIVHSDEDENNLYQEFNSLQEAISYARDNIEDKTFVDKIFLDQDGEIESSETVWSYADE